MATLKVSAAPVSSSWSASDTLSFNNGGTTRSINFTNLFGGAFETVGSLKFPATQIAVADANTLDDYEEGTFTSTIVSSGGGTPTYSSQAGQYTKTGDRCLFTIGMQLATLGTLAAGSLTIENLPFTPTSTAGQAIVASNLAATATTQVMAGTASGTAAIALFRFAAGALANLGQVDITATALFRLSGNFKV